MPQILRQFGLSHAVVWRGVPAAVDKDAFWWTAPDGSTVRAEYLPQGYGNGAYLPDDAKQLVERVRQFEEDHADRLLGPILWMNGTDHQVPRPWLGRVVAEANDVQDDYHLEVCSLADYLAAAPTGGLAEWSGELRSGAHANLLMGVASNRVDVKQAAAAAERGLERLAEPLCALALDPAEWPEALLAEAWLAVIRNSAHDSVCACSIDTVCDAVLHRYHEAIDIAAGLTDRAVARLAANSSTAGTMVLNPSPRARSGVVELRLPGEGDEAGLQLLSQRPTELRMATTRGEAVQIVDGALEHQSGFFHADVTVDDDSKLVITLDRDTDRGERIAAGPVVKQIRTLAGDAPDGLAEVLIRRPPVRRMLARIDDLAGYGWRGWTPAVPDIEAVRATDTAMTNGLVTVEIDPSDATFAVDDLRGFGQLVDDGDSGDTYNYNPPGHDVVVDRPDSVEVSVLEHGPLRARMAIDARYTWPERIIDDARFGEQQVAIRTEVELQAGERLVRVTTTVDNNCRDHRLRVWFPLPDPAATSSAECAFGPVQRGVEAEGGPSEHGLPTFPSRRFVQAGGLTVVHDGLLEYELVDVVDGQARSVALTLLRATGMLSQGPMAYRPLPAGPLTPMEGPQVRGVHTFRYAVQSGPADPYRLVDDAFLPLITAPMSGRGSGLDHGRLLELAGAEVSAIAREGDALTVRVFNPSADPVTVDLGDRSGWRVDLRGRAQSAFEGGFELGPFEIATVRLAEPAR
jgi:hypothetical protein